MKVHIRVHTNDRPYHCPYKGKCNQAFKTKSQLSDHILKHTQIKNFQCPECRTCFARKSRLKIHMMIHKGEKPFECIKKNRVGVMRMHCPQLLVACKGKEQNESKWGIPRNRRQT